LLAAAQIRFDRKEYEAALGHYTRLRAAASFSGNVLEAEVGAMRSNFLLNRYPEAAEYASSVLAQSSVPERIIELARLIRGKAAFKQNDYSAASSDFNWLASNAKGAEGAEAKYLIAEMAFRQNDLNSAEKEIFELIQGYASYDSWKIKGFLLLADVYIERKDYFQARATLQSIIDNVQNPQSVAEANSKMQKIADLEATEKAANEKRQENEAPLETDPYRELIEEPSNSNDK
jgi:TolA-binding protein